MAAFTLTDTSIYAGALDASCFGNTVDLGMETETVDATTFCSGGWRVFIPGLKSWSASFAGPQDMAATTAANTLTPDEHYLLTVGTAYPLMFVPQGAAESSVAYGSNGLLNMYVPLGGSVGDLAEQSTQWSPATTNMPLVRGVLATKQTVTATGSGTGHQLGAVTASQRLYAGVHFLTAGGTTPSITVILESDDNAGFTSATTRATFAAATTRSAQWTSVAGAIADDYYRLRWTVSGSGPSFQVRGFIGIL
jgi:hypothetical protein